MTMRYKNSLFQVILITTWIYISHGCQMEGVTTWFTPVTTTVVDTHSGSFYNRATTDIVGINSITYGEGLNSGPYVQVTHSNSIFDITTNAAYQNYEENETAQSMTFTVVFGCTGGSTGTLVFIINVIDTNNNPPQFLPTNQFEFIVTPPLPPGYQITGCLQDITVRDIDLTTQRIDFAIEPNEYFEIDYDASLSTDPKEFKAVLRTTTFIRTLSEPIELIINATDVDLTGDPPITTSATVRITPDTEFQFPEELLFSQPYYMARYEDNQVISDDPITLQEGFHELVQFSLEGEHSTYFDLRVDGNQLSLAVIEPLSLELLREGQLVLAVRAEREFTSGATATVLIQLPEVTGLRFDNTLYEGRILDDTMEPLQLVVAQGYEVGFSVALTGDSSAFFTTAVQDNIISLTLNDPPNSLQSSFITLQVSAFNEFSTASAVVTLDVIRDDDITPAFEMTIYSGSYEPELGLTLESIALVQGYDETVSFNLEGEHASYFEVTQNGPVLSVITSPLPAQVLSERNLILSLLAAKPRTVGANAAIYIELPPARELGFESSTYIGSIEEDNLVLEPVIMNIGYGDDISFSLSGDYATYFNLSNVQNQILVIQSTPLPQDVISFEDFLILTLSASGELTVTASTVLILEIVKLDTNTPVFGQSVYEGSYSEFNLELGNISLVQGYDSSVSFRLDGEYANYFDISNTENNNIFITMASNIPEQLIFDEKVLLFDVIADKPLTVGAKAVVAIRFPPELTELTALKFAQNTYIGSVENNMLALDSITLSGGYNNATEFTLTGAYASYFTFTSNENIVSISVLEPLPVEVLPSNRYIILELEAERYQAVSAVTSIIIDLILPVLEQPLFAQPYYRGYYTENSGLQMEQEIFLTQGFDETVTFSLDGDSSQWFILSSSDNSVDLEVNGSIPSEVIESNHQLLFTIVASKLGASPGETVISIELPKEMDPVILRFEQNSYVGRIESGELQSPSMTLLGDNIQQLELNISGEYATYFTLLRESNNVLLELSGDLPNDIEESFIVLNIEASTLNSVTGYTTVVIEIVNDPVIVRPMFEQAYYVGEYSEEGGLLFEHNIQLIDGFDESVSFILEGADAQWFELIYNENETLSLVFNNNVSLPVEDRSQLIFSIVANKLNSLPGRATIVIILADYPQTPLLQFSQIFYKGTIENSNLTMEAISLDGYSADIDISIAGDYVNYFQLLNQDGALSIELLSPLPNDVIDNNTVLILTLEAQVPATSTRATIVIELPTNQMSSMTFEEIYYVGSYSESSNLIFDSQISLSSGYEESVSFYLEGDNSVWFDLVTDGNAVSLILTSPIPPAIVLSNQQLIFTVTASKPEDIAAKATIVVSLTSDITESGLLGFNKISYLGSIENDQVNLEQILLSEGYSENVTFTLLGELAPLFNLINDDGTITIALEGTIPEDSIPASQIIVLEIQASAPQYISTYATIVFEILREESIVESLLFSEVYYTGQYTEEEGLSFGDISLLQGYYDNVTFGLEGEHSQWFGLLTSETVLTLNLVSPIPPAVLLNNQQLVFIVTAQELEKTAKATIIISLPDQLTEISILGFNKISYLGTLDNDQINLEPVVVSEGYNENISFTLHGDFADFFTISSQEEIVTVTLQNSIPEEILRTNRIVVLEIQASALEYVSSYATIVLEVLDNDVISEDLAFTELYYMGLYTQGDLIFEGSISLSQGFDEAVEFSLEGENSQWFNLVISENSVTFTSSNIPQEVLDNNQNLIFTIVAEKPEGPTARAVIIVSILSDGETTTGASFERALYEGVVREGGVQHETIILSGYNGTEVQVFGTYAELFEASVSDGSVTVQAVSSVTLVPNVVYVALELRASASSTVLLLDIEHEDANLPNVTFVSTSYSIRIDVSQTGLFGQVEATASNGEAISYSLLTQDDHLSQRISVNQEGELHLSAPADRGVYNFEVIATTLFSNVSGNAVVQLTVDDIAECGDDKVVPSLIILHRDEEEPHTNLVIINEDHAGCRYILTNRWPADQTWLYVDDIGLHANAIDREDASIAFMALSQIQVELLLDCDTYNLTSITTRNKRSVNPTPNLSHLGPYDYGDSTWILTDSILYNSRRTVVNLIVNDINDNYPIFVGKDEEPITVGYPIPALEERVSPRALIELQATDADVGENAALVYWSSDEALAVSPSSGRVHVRENARLEDGATISVFATDQNGQGLTGNLTLLVKLLDVTNIAVVTIQDAFLEDEQAILENLSTTVGYEVKSLRATVVSDGLISENALRSKREVTTFGASLQIYVYGLIEREPVLVDRLTTDLTNDMITTVTITRTVSLEDHLEEMRDSSGRATGLLVSTIVLSVLLFILIVLAAVWFFLKWRKERNYDKFKDESSTASLDESGEVPKQEELLPRLNIEELKKSEKRLQERLEAPDVTVEPSSSKREPSLPSKTESVTAPIPNAPASIVIQDKLKDDGDGSDDEDEFGERKTPRRKSVVTFNENVEKIIHVESSTSDDESSINEVYKL